MTAPANTFTALSYNIGGLAGLVSTNDRVGPVKEIGKRIADWDIVNVQEDLYLHAFLYDADTHAYRSESDGGVTYRRNGVDGGSGLNTLSRLPFSNTSTFGRTKWVECSNFDGRDCDISKGFSLVEIQIADGVSLDVYNLHADTVFTAEDEKARAANLAQLGDFIAANSASNAVLVMGDTNTKYTSAGDTIREFLDGQKLTDAWVQTIRKGKAPEKGSPELKCDLAAVTNDCEVSNRILFRGNNYINLAVDTWNNEHKAFLAADGKTLSNNVPVSSKFSWTLNPDLHLSNAYGGPHAVWFSDIALAAPGQTVTSVTIRSGRWLITSMELHWGSHKGKTRIFYLKFSTNKDHFVEGGHRTAASTIAKAPDGFQLVGFHGRSGDEIDALGAIFTKVAAST
ncbi:hypothetical protein PHYSODRAFT_249965 [Phytophthora sojae]|uniref:Jacalin-type lectin domain-containing protein n=1 Tax=Phytophthora sojae (strain P6497) TaxID=1094619 RepID=G5AC83_PHYSP|nr:hypothetical protein PHYSODRAFT_249965 [Phytophthora sojae]EGZ06957.1 hypothetical protein PHYSODRAFT_249965 [Phytophthora sojae]|eukprot:XP_009537721.1 hypothetical protein PHYSODRAFT_249965 [Phytophthora sojae]